MDGRGLANAIARDGSVLEIEQEEEEERTEEEVEGGMPSNLRIEEWQGKRVEFMGIKASHRDLVSIRFFFLSLFIILFFDTGDKVTD